ncbi:TPA: hypothetical protein J2F85_003403 [Escherichia coli]|nr:hypothetical protein [Escherichia coli]
MLGLDFQPEHYDLVHGQSGAKFRAIPITDWFPPDYVDVNAKTKECKLVQIYYSPACGNLCMTDLEQKLTISADLIDYWLKEVE